MANPNEPESVTFDELEQQSSQPPATDLTKIMLDGDSVPEIVRGKNVTEALQAMEQALKTSEQARLAQQQPQAAAPAAPPPEEPKDLTDEEIARLYEDDPLVAIKAMNEQAVRRAEKNLASRIEPLASSAAAQVENAARSKYADEFQLFGAEIAAIAQQIPNARQVLANPAAWDDIISLVRGRPQNFEKLVAHKTQPRTDEIRRQAVADQRESVGFSDNGGSGRGRMPAVPEQLDATQREIAQNLGMTPAEYVKWSKIG